MAPLRMVALGSSFAAGSGIPPKVDSKAMRSGRNYAHLLAARLDAELIDLTTAGATLLDVLDQSQKLVGFWAGSAPPQLEGLPGDADLVTLTAGGNDLGYSHGMLLDALKSVIRNVPLIGRLISPYLGPSSDKSTITVNELTSRFIAIIDKITSVAPDAKIVFIDYLTIFSPNSLTGPGNPLSDAEMLKYREIGRDLQQAYQDATEARPSVLLLSASTMSIEHGVGTAEPWVTGFGLEMIPRGEVPYHPNALGHEKIAEELHKLLTESVSNTEMKSQ